MAEKGKEKSGGSDKEQEIFVVNSERFEELFWCTLRAILEKLELSRIRLAPWYLIGWYFDGTNSELFWLRL